MRLAARAPNHLGDGVMALSAMRGLAELGKLTIYAPRWGSALYRDLPAAVVPRGVMASADAAVLFPPSLRAALEARWCQRRVGVAADYRSWLLTDVVQPANHRVDTYRRLAEAVGAKIQGESTFTARNGDPEIDVPAGHVGMNPVSVSGETVEWGGFEGLASRLKRPVIFYGGPGEHDRVRAVANGHDQRVGLSLPHFAKALERCAVFVSNDSGAAHFARACGTPTVVVFGSTTAARTGPRGAIAVEGPELSCRPCYAKRCTRNLECLDIEVDRVLRAVQEALDG